MKFLFEGRFLIVLFLLVCTVLLIVYSATTLTPPATQSSATSCIQSFGSGYTGALWTKDGETAGRICLLESNRMRVDHHVRKLPDGSTINDWLWIDYGDRVNVLVRETSGKFLVLEQTKYALEVASLAVVGGFIDKNEAPAVAAAREVKEELGVTCDTITALGKYRTDVNRGLGWVYGFIAQKCSAVNSNELEVEVEDADKKQEVQELRRLSVTEIEDAVMSGRFVEVQWRFESVNV